MQHHLSILKEIPTNWFPLNPERSKYVERNRIKWSQVLHSAQSTLRNSEIPEQRKLKCTIWVEPKKELLVWSPSPGVGRKELLKTAAHIWVSPPLPPSESFQKKYQVKSPPVDNSWKRQRNALLPTTQEETEGSKDCPCNIYPLCSLHEFVPLSVFTEATPTLWPSSTSASPAAPTFLWKRCH